MIDGSPAAPWKIVDLEPDDEDRQGQAAALLVSEFADHWPRAWPDHDSALAEVRQSLGDGRISRVALTELGEVIGWIGAIREYYGQAWELHPLVVHQAYRRKGVGTALVLDLESAVRAAGGIMIFLGTDDEDHMTTLGGVDLYPDVLGHLSRIQDLKGHPYTFYQRLGYSIVGVIPDANGPGKPDILMAKRLIPG